MATLVIMCNWRHAIACCSVLQCVAVCCSVLRISMYEVLYSASYIAPHTLTPFSENKKLHLESSKQNYYIFSF